MGVWPPPEVRAVLMSLPRPDNPRVRWTAPHRWHVTLAFLGDVAEEGREQWTAALVAATEALESRPRAVLGPATVLLGPAVLCVPAAGLEPAAEAFRSTALALGLGDSLDPRPFRGHLTVARGRGRARIPAKLAGTPLEARWTVGELCLVAAVRDRYETLAAATIGQRT